MRGPLLSACLSGDPGTSEGNLPLALQTLRAVPPLSLQDLQGIKLNLRSMYLGMDFMTL